MLAIGDTFRLAQRGINDHPFVVISDPAKDPTQIVTANFTSWAEGKDKDPSCIVEPGEHKAVTHRSCMYYGNNAFTLELYERLRKSGALVPQDPVSRKLLERILAGAAVTRSMPLGNKEALASQGLIDLS